MVRSVLETDFLHMGRRILKMPSDLTAHSVVFCDYLVILTISPFASSLSMSFSSVPDARYLISGRMIEKSSVQDTVFSIPGRMARYIRPKCNAFGFRTDDQIIVRTRYERTILGTDYRACQKTPLYIIIDTFQTVLAENKNIF